MTFSHFIKVLSCILPIVALFLANGKLNLSKLNRARQFAMPVIALIYGIVMLILFGKVETFIHALHKLFMKLGEFLPFLQNIAWDSIAIYVLNCVFLAGFIAVKGILLPILSKLWASSQTLTEKTSGLFYEYDERTGQWFVKKECAKFRGYYRGFYYALFAVSVLFFALSQLYPHSSFFQGVFYPCFGVVLFSEVVSFLSGMTQAEFVEDILGEDEESYKVANYGLLREILRKLFPTRVLYENTLDTNDGDSGTFEALDTMLQSEDPDLRIAGKYFQQLRSSGANIDINYVNNSVNLLKGESTLFCNPFYRDLTHYLVLPVVHQLISFKKCLIIVGRDETADNVRDWMESGMVEFAGTDSLWRTKVLNYEYDEFDIGIIKPSDIHNLKLHQNNKDFFEKVGMVIMIEPSRILSSYQVGLSLLVSECEDKKKEIVYCACDRNCDGLVDSLSHLLKTSITSVTATLRGGANSSQMYWDADGGSMHHKILPNISRFLGVGTEINTVALKYQIPEVSWIGGEKFPVADMKWIAGQYYKQICDYADLPVSQDSFNRAFHVSADLWNSSMKDNAFYAVEDEFRNLFEMTRVFSSRAMKQGFVNVISENYFLRDYMLDNVKTFSADPKAIPTIVPDFARTERNLVLKLVMRMVNMPIRESDIENELMLCGIRFTDAYATLRGLIAKHCNVTDPSLSVRFKEELSEDSINTTVIKFYEINESNELYTYAQILKNAYYIAEDEENESHYIGAKLYGHVFQAMLPGQFITLDGKYYEVRTITPLNGVVLRRAADHITDRRYYRQIQKLQLANWHASTEMGAKKSVADLEITYGFADITVATDGYLEMLSYGDWKNGKKVLINDIPERHYRNKSVLRVRLPEVTPQVKYTMCFLLNEIFKTTYPSSHQYISAVIPQNGVNQDEKLKYMLPDVSGCEDDDCIYIIEDSEIDLGLIVSVERNLNRYFEIISDVLSWHMQKMAEVVPEPVEEEPYVPVFVPVPPAEKKSVLKKVREFFGKLFGRKKKKGEEETAEGETPAGNAPEGESAEGSEGTTPTEGAEEPKKKKGIFARIRDFFSRKKEQETEEEAPQSDIPAETGAGTEEAELPAAEEEAEAGENEEEAALPEEEPALQSTCVSPAILLDEEPASAEEAMDIGGEDEELAAPPQKTAYQKHNFLQLGYDDVPAILQIRETMDYLSKYGFDDNPLRRVRSGLDLAQEIEETYDPSKFGTHICDFCGVELKGGEYVRLKDGRERCNRCSMTAVKKADDFREIFKNVLRNMEIFYGIKINTPIKVRTTDAKKIAKHVGSTFIATPGFDGRVLGFAQRDRTGYSIYVENGSPKLAAVATIAHELTHIWQYLNWNDKDLIKAYGQENLLEVYEGMAKWVEIQYLLLLNEVAYAKRQEILTKLRDDAYGRGFIKYLEKYSLSYGTSVTNTPFNHKLPF